MIHIRTHSHWYDFHTAVYYSLANTFPFFMWLAAVLPTGDAALPGAIPDIQQKICRASKI